MMSSEKNHLVIRNLYKKYAGSSLYALSDVSLDLTPGIYGILGANGAGKSTLFNILTGIIDKTEGEIFFNGQDISKMPEEFKGQMGYMPQQQALYPDLSVEKFITYMAVLKEIPKKSLKEEVNRALQATDVEHLREKPMSALSGGMKQRVLISQALLANPQVLILDEPTAGLDPKQRVIIRNLVSNLSKDKIILISTHVVSDIEHISKEIIILKKGEVILQDTPQGILEKYERIVYESVLTNEDLKEVQDHYEISQMQMRADGQVYVKIYGDFTEPPKTESVTFHPAAVDLEDVYLYLFDGEK